MHLYLSAVTVLALASTVKSVAAVHSHLVLSWHAMCDRRTTTAALLLGAQTAYIAMHYHMCVHKRYYL
jgi:hypothetical protein